MTAGPHFSRGRWRERLARIVIPVSFALAALGILGIGFLAFYLLRQTEDMDALVMQTAVDVSRLEHLHLQIVETESAGRAFLVTGDPGLREAFNKELADIDDDLRVLKQMPSNDGDQHKLVAELERQINRRFAYLEALISARTTRGLEGLQGLTVGSGFAEMGAINNTLREMKERQKRLLQERTRLRQERDLALESGLKVGLLAGTLILMALFVYANRMWRLRREAEAVALHLAHHDALTGLPNRRLVEDRLQVGLAHAKRNKNLLAVLCLDLDGFKQVNDTYGHDGGDELLRAVAQRLLAAVRAEDTVARLGGDEFLVMVAGIADATHTAAIAEKIIEAVSAPYELQAGPASIGTSVGIAHFPTHASSASDLVKQGDLALYAAKESGKGRYALARSLA